MVSGLRLSIGFEYQNAKEKDCLAALKAENWLKPPTGLPLHFSNRRSGSAHNTVERPTGTPIFRIVEN
jgi:hypothetical protein